jgi:polyhydroxyalkanoate depolymerase
MTTYQLYQAQADLTAQMRGWATIANTMLHTSFGDALAPYGMRQVTAGFDMMARAGITHTRPDFGITSVMVGETEVPVVEEVADVTPCATLLHFKKAGTTTYPPVLIVAPMSGHFSTLLRGTVRTMLPDHDVYLTDWHNARDIDVAAGRFGSDEYVDHLIRFL